MQIRLTSILILNLLFFSVKTSAQDAEKSLRKAYTLLTIAQEKDRQAAEKLDEIKSKRIQSEEELVDLNDIRKPNAEQKKQKSKIEKQVSALKKQESDIFKKRQEASIFLTDVTELIKAPESKRAKFIASYEKKNGEIYEGKYPENIEPAVTTVPTEQPSPTVGDNTPIEAAKPMTEAVSEMPPATSPPVTKKSKKQSSKKNKPDARSNGSAPSKVSEQAAKIARKYDSKTDVIVNPPPPDCQIAFDGVDKFTERKKRETYPQVVFKHTEDFMRAAMKDKDYIVCEASVSRIQGGFYFLNLNFTIQTKEAQKAFGFLDKGTPIVFKLINGKTLPFTNSKTDIGTVNADNGTTTYKSQIQLSGSDVKYFMESELDVIRVAWSAGYEDYEIYDMDVLANLFKCLEKENK